MGIALGGIGGFDTQNIVKQLMYLERKSGNVLYEKKSSIEKSVKAYQSLNTQLANLAKDAWAIFGKKDKFDQQYKINGAAAVWEAAKGTSSNEKVGVTTEAGAQVGSVKFDVISLATAKQMTFDESQLKALVGEEGSETSISIAMGDKVVNLTPASASAQDVAKAINSVKDAGVTATAVRIGDGADGKGEYVLQINGKNAGSKTGDFQLYSGDITKGLAVDPKDTKTDTLSNSRIYTFEDSATLSGALAGKTAAQGEVTQNATDAKINLLGKERTYSSNTIELMDHVKVDISKVVQETKADGSPVQAGVLASGIEVKVERDSDVSSNKVEEMVKGLNNVLETLDRGMQTVERTRRDEDGKLVTWKAPGTLSTSVGRGVQNQLAEAISSGITVEGENGTSQTYSLQEFGIDLSASKGSSEMTVTFDAEKFKSAMEANPARVQKVMTALADKVAEVANSYSDSASGILSQTIESNKNEVSYYKDRIDEFDDRMIRKEAMLQRQYSALETLLAGYNQKQAWLTSQLASLGGGR